MPTSVSTDLNRLQWPPATLVAGGACFIATAAQFFSSIAASARTRALGAQVETAF